MRTLLVSDLHLGALHGRARLEDPAAVEALREAVAEADRLILLGDVIELRERPSRDALAAASRVLPSLSGAMAPGSEIVLVAGNHDHQLSRPGELRDAAVSMLSGDAVTVTTEYPGVWLRDDVFATHGHYLDRHTTTPAFERLAAGVMTRLRRRALAGGPGGADDYERVLAPIYAWLQAIGDTEPPLDDEAMHRPREPGGSTRILKRLRESRGLESRALDLGIRGLVTAVSAAGLGPLSGDLSGEQLRRAALTAIGEVLSRLGIDAGYAIFGHSHRAGPLPGDDLQEWTTPTGIRLFNSGCWVNEPVTFLGDEPSSSPYRAGFAVELDDSGPPRLVNLLDRA